MSIYAEYYGGLITIDELRTAARQEAWLDEYLEEEEEEEEDHDRPTAD